VNLVTMSTWTRTVGGIVLAAFAVTLLTSPGVQAKVPDEATVRFEAML
jgi:hypothetical protein